MPPIDLNLIRAFVAIYEARSVGAAAERLHVTQPTASYSLSRLRTLLQDQLFTRSRDGMLPTPAADRIYGGFVSALRAIEHTVETARTFDPSASTRRFTLAMTDIGEMIFVPPILRRLSEQAPDVEMEIVQIPLEDLPRRLATGEVAGAVGNFPLTGAQIRKFSLFHEHYMCLVSRSHSEIDADLTLDLFRAARHVHVGSASTGHVMVEQALATADIGRHVVLSISHFAILSHVIANSDLLAIVPSRVAALFERYEAVRAARIPFEIPPFEVQLLWHANDDASSANKWFRSIIVEALREGP